MANYGDLTPVNIITGFLGSGKTTLLQRLLRSPALSDVAVLVNEFGEVGLDHHLLQNVAESTLLLENGCLCCAVRGDLQKALRDLLSRRTRGDIPHFRRVVIETSGLADPAPIAYTLLSEAVLRHHFRLSGIITTVDAVNGASQLDSFAESVKQVSMADRLVVTKTDLSDEPSLTALRRRLRSLNISAQIVELGEIGGDLHQLLTDDIYDAAGKFREAARWTAEEVDAAFIARPHLGSSILCRYLRPAAGLDRVRRLGQHAVASPRRRCASSQGSVECRRRADAGPDQRRSAYRASAQSPGSVARRRPALASHLHRARP